MCSHFTVAEFIGDEYDKIKRTLKKEWHKTRVDDFDEDVFHDTLIKSMEQLNGKELPSSEIMSYIVSAFKTNIIRDLMYAHTQNRSDDEVETMEIETRTKDDIDFNLITSSVQQKFGNEEYETFLDWLEGMTIKELNEKYNKTNNRYIIERIKKYIQNKFGNDLLT